ncbi:hypothetical protein HaLaN_05947 [Haematococcus lacustris]|uniref:Uncharacterized protein n=1 Tax=Haematococcus lacustris TaxID=44745 RepID=A0A699YUF1_HAELA|nr:hypothetical protein HaLaN_05947 [Haematococcus lacustris]
MEPSDLTSPSSTPASVQPAWARHPTASDTSFTTPMSAESSAYTSAAGPDQGGPEPGDSGEEGSDAVDAAAALLLARSRSLLRQRDPVEERIQALLARFQPAAPISRRGDDSNAQPGPAVESATATKGHRGAGDAAGPHTGQGPSTAASAAASQSLAVAAAGSLLNVGYQGAKAGTAPAGQDTSWRQRLRSLLQEVDQQAGLLPAFPAAAPHPKPATPSQGCC